MTARSHQECPYDRRKRRTDVQAHQTCRVRRTAVHARGPLSSRRCPVSSPGIPFPSGSTVRQNPGSRSRANTRFEPSGRRRGFASTISTGCPALARQADQGLGDIRRFISATTAADAIAVGSPSAETRRQTLARRFERRRSTISVAPTILARRQARGARTESEEPRCHSCTIGCSMNSCGVSTPAGCRIRRNHSPQRRSTWYTTTSIRPSRISAKRATRKHRMAEDAN